MGFGILAPRVAYKWVGKDNLKFIFGASFIPCCSQLNELLRNGGCLKRVVDWRKKNKELLVDGWLLIVGVASKWGVYAEMRNAEGAIGKGGGHREAARAEAKSAGLRGTWRVEGGASPAPRGASRGPKGASSAAALGQGTLDDRRLVPRYWVAGRLWGTVC